MNKNLSYAITAVLSIIAGFLFYKWPFEKPINNLPSNSDTLKGTTVLKIKDGKYFLTYQNIVPLSREITKEEYDLFIKQYPSGEAPSNVLDKFSSYPPKYTIIGSKYYESVWDGEKYGSAIEITQEEYGFLTNRQTLVIF